MLRMKPLVNESKIEENFRKLTIEQKQLVNNKISTFNKFNEHVYRPTKVSEVVGAIKELCNLAGKVALSETAIPCTPITVFTLPAPPLSSALNKPPTIFEVVPVLGVTATSA